MMRFVGSHRQDMPKGIAYSVIDYREMVDCMGRCIRDDKAGYIEQHYSYILASWPRRRTMVDLNHRI